MIAIHTRNQSDCISLLFDRGGRRDINKIYAHLYVGVVGTFVGSNDDAGHALGMLGCEQGALLVRCAGCAIRGGCFVGVAAALERAAATATTAVVGGAGGGGGSFRDVVRVGSRGQSRAA